MFKQKVKTFIRRLGYDVQRLSPLRNPTAQLFAALNHVRANLVFDIGANRGQFGQELRSVGYSEDIVSFEPLSSAHELLSRAARQDAKWYVHSRSAIGDTDGEVQIHLAGNSVSSSILPMLDAHSSSEPSSRYISSESTAVVRLDSVADSYLSAESRIFIKIDTQGYESQVLDGAKDILGKAKGLSIELSLVPLYEGQALWREIIQRLESEGFVLWSIQRGFTDPHNGRSLQIDGIFLRLES